jgi:hypothetical protein
MVVTMEARALGLLRAGFSEAAVALKPERFFRSETPSRFGLTEIFRECSVTVTVRTPPS